MQTVNRNKLVLFKSMLVTCMSAITSFYISAILSLAMQSYLNTFHNSINQDLERSIYSVLTYFLLFAFVSMSTWILFSSFIPKNWILFSFITALFAGLLIGARKYFIIEKYPLMSLYLQLLDTSVLGGFLVTIPQWVLLKKHLGQTSNNWLVVNFVGWGLIGLFWMQEPPLMYILMGNRWTILFDFIQQYRIWGIVELCSFMPLGIGIGLFFTHLNAEKKLEDKSEVG